MQRKKSNAGEGDRKKKSSPLRSSFQGWVIPSSCFFFGIFFRDSSTAVAWFCLKLHIICLKEGENNCFNFFFWFSREEEKLNGKRQKNQKTSFSSLSLINPLSSRLPVDRQQLGLEDERGPSGDLGRGAHGACVQKIKKKRKERVSFFSFLRSFRRSLSLSLFCKKNNSKNCKKRTVAHVRGDLELALLADAHRVEASIPACWL